MHRSRIIDYYDNYEIFLKGKELLAYPIQKNYPLHYAILEEQGYIKIELCSDIYARDVNEALSNFKELSKQENVKLKQEIAELKSEKKVLENSPCQDNSILYHQLFGFDEFPDKDELTKRYKELANILHPDKGYIKDDKFMQLLNKARKYLNQKVEKQ